MRAIRIPDHLAFQDRAEPASEERIAAAEHQLRRRIPGAYRQFLTLHNSGRIVPPNFRLPREDGANEYGSVSWFLGVDTQESLSLTAIAEMYDGRLPQDLLAIARDPGGNLICMDEHGAVFFWDHELEDDEDDDDAVDREPSRDNVRRIADDFESFLASLQE